MNEIIDVDDHSQKKADTDGIINVDNLTKHFGAVKAVKGVDFTVNEGEFFSLLGPSGCGKTTTLRLIAGFENATDGTIHIDGKDVTDSPPYSRDLGMVFQGYALFPHKTVGENVGFGLKMDNVPKDERERRISDILETVSLSGYQERYPKELSGGQQQRVALARALVVEPSVLLLDEPLANLDLKLRQKMRFELQRILNKTNTTTIYVTHDQEEALSMSDRIAIMNEGKIEQVSSPTELYYQPENRFVADFVGEANLLNGTVSSMNGTGGDIKLNIGPTVSFDNRSNTLGTNYSEGDRITINVRPEDFEIHCERLPKRNSIPGTINAKTFLGNVTQILVQANDQEILVETSGRKAHLNYDIDDEVVLSWDEESAIILSGGKDGVH